MPDDDTCPRYAGRHHRRIGRAELPAAAQVMLARLAALIAVDAPPASSPRQRRGRRGQRATADDMQGVMRGCPGRGHGAGGLGRREDPQGLGFAIAVAEDEMADEGDA